MYTKPNTQLPGQILTSHGLSIYVETFGDPSQPAVLLTHGGYQSSTCWRHQVHGLSQHWFVITWDVPFHGLSGPHTAEAEAQLAPNDLFALGMRTVVEEFHLHEKGFVQVGWSMGGIVTRNYLLTYGSQGMLGLVLVGSVLDFSIVAQFATSEVAQILAGFTSSQQDVRTTVFLQFINLLWHRQPSYEEYLLTLGYNTQAFLRENPLSNNVTRAMAGVPGNIEALVEQAGFPILGIAGQQDALMVLPLMQDYMRKLTHSTLLEYEQCGHSPFQEDPTRFNQDLDAFLTQVFAHTHLKSTGTPR
jgi:pimeloyl-ACP methyl ester carboxylesterase